MPIVKYLLLRGASTKFVDEEGGTPLLSACYFGKVKIVKYLLTRRLSSIEERDGQNRNGLFLAAEGGSLKTVQYLFSYIASPDSNLFLDERTRGDPVELFRKTFTCVLLKIISHKP